MNQTRICTAVLHFLTRKPLAAEKQVERRKALDSDATLAFPLWPENSNLPPKTKSHLFILYVIYNSKSQENFFDLKG